MVTPAIGIIGGSGLYEIEGFLDTGSCRPATPFGEPSDAIITGTMSGRQVCFLPRHGAGHRLMPHEIPHRANVWALRSLGVRWIISVSAVGSLCEEMAPRHLAVPDQLIDRTGTAAKHTFFGNGIAAHIAFAEPYCVDLRRLLVEAARAETPHTHDGGAYLCMNGPAFSTRAESHMHRLLGAKLIGMTNAPEARLAREAEISLATLALVTDYDCWKDDEPHVEAAAVIATMKHNAALAKRVIARIIGTIPEIPASAAHRALDSAIMTPRPLWPEETARNLAPILGGR